LGKTKRLSLSKLLEDLKPSNDNLHRIAISNIADGDRQLERWWQKKYKTSIKHYNDYTREELIIEMLEDFYDNNKTEIDRFYDSIEKEQIAKQGEWDGRTSPEYEAEIQKRLSKFKKIDLSAFQSEKDKELTAEEEDAILDSLGRNLPKSKKTKEKGIPALGSDEFDEEFGV
jgi:hypothetical protein